MDILVVDDLRTFYFPAVYARQISDAWVMLMARHWDEVWLDHDMGMGREFDGDTLARMIESYAAKDGKLLDVGVFIVHSMNPVGREAISNSLRDYYNVRFADPSRFIKKGK